MQLGVGLGLAADCKISAELRVSHLILNFSDSPKQNPKGTSLSDKDFHFAAKFKRTSTLKNPRKKMLYKIRVNTSDTIFLKIKRKMIKSDSE